MNTNEKRIWFPAKRYGWGWGPPCAWQGWLVIGVFVVLLSTAGFLFLPGKHYGLWIASIVILLTLLMVVCYAKGESPRWRWGDKDKPETPSSAARLAELEDLHQRHLISDGEYDAQRQKILREL